MRAICFGVLAAFVAGCSSPTWEVVEGPTGAFLVERNSGKTWYADNVHLAGDQSTIPTWREMGHSRATTQPCAVSSTSNTTAINGTATLELPYAVSFVGVQDVFGRNALGDAIVVTAVHGTAGTIAVGNTYRIDGAYTLASHDQATLSTYLTGAQPDEPHRKMIPGQSLRIQKGSGTFTVFLKVEDPGCPHVSLYPGDGGQSFSGEYFGTGEFLPPESWRPKSQFAIR